MGNSKEEIRQAFRARVKEIACPRCGEFYSDWALDWGEAWYEGRRDLLAEMGGDERDGPYKLCCELCDTRVWLNYFAFTVEVVS